MWFWHEKKQQPITFTLLTQCNMPKLIGGGRQQAGVKARHAAGAAALGARGPLPVNLKGGLVYFQGGGGSICCALYLRLLK